MGRGRDGVGWSRVGLKSRSILALATTFVWRGKPVRDEGGKGASSGVRQNCHP